MLFWNSRKREHREKAGGFAFFLSLAFLIFLSGYHLYLLPALWDTAAGRYTLYAGAGTFMGSWFAIIFIHGHLSVYLHELRHAVVSWFVGNKYKGIHVERDRGHYQYEGTTATVEYNAFILLAPYFLPLCTAIAILPAAILAYADHVYCVIVVCVGYGLDLVLNLRDISRRQTDITRITGGYSVGVLYIAFMNLTIATILAAWVFQGWLGIRFLIAGLWFFMLQVVAYYKGM